MAVKKQKKSVKKNVRMTKAAKPASSKISRKTSIPKLIIRKSTKTEPAEEKVKTVIIPKIKLPHATKKEFRDMLMGLRDRLTGQITALKGDSLQRFDAANTEEDGTDAFERQFALNLVSSEQDALFEIDEALRRLDDSTYGVCLQCGKLIESPRLKALPFVKMCVKCQSDNEKSGRRTSRFGETVVYNTETSEQEEPADSSDSI